MPYKKTEKEKKTAKPNAPCCFGCVKWSRFGKECWVYWDNKKVCTQYAGSWNEAASIE